MTMLNPGMAAPMAWEIETIGVPLLPVVLAAAAGVIEALTAGVGGAGHSDARSPPKEEQQMDLTLVHFGPPLA